MLHQGQLRAVGKSQAQPPLLSISARLIEGKPLRVVAKRVKMAGHSLRWRVSRIEQRRTYYTPALRAGGRGWTAWPHGARR